MAGVASGVSHVPLRRRGRRIMSPQRCHLHAAVAAADGAVFGLADRCCRAASCRPRLSSWSGVARFTASRVRLTRGSRGHNHVGPATPVAPDREPQHHAHCISGRSAAQSGGGRPHALTRWRSALHIAQAQMCGMVKTEERLGGDHDPDPQVLRESEEGKHDTE